jgi:hypothetical protein
MGAIETIPHLITVEHVDLCKYRVMRVVHGDSDD